MAFISSVLCDFTSVAFSPIFLATYLTISVCIGLAAILALNSLHIRMKCTGAVDDDNFMRLIAVSDTAKRVFDQRLKYRKSVCINNTSTYMYVQTVAHVRYDDIL